MLFLAKWMVATWISLLLVSAVFGWYEMGRNMAEDYSVDRPYLSQFIWWLTVCGPAIILGFFIAYNNIGFTPVK